MGGHGRRARPPDLEDRAHRQRELHLARGAWRPPARWLTNKYAEGQPGKRYYGGCEYVDVVERLAEDRALALFPGAESVNVQPHSGAQANIAAYLAVLEPGDTILGMSLAHGGHLTHGHPMNFSGPLLRGPRLRRRRRPTGASTTTPSSARRERSGPSSSWPVPAPTRGSSTSSAWPRSPTTSDALLLRGHGPHRRPGGGRRAPQSRSRMPTSSPRPPTRPCAAPVVASSSATPELATRHRPGRLPGHPGRTADARHRRQGRRPARSCTAMTSGRTSDAPSRTLLSWPQTLLANGTELVVGRHRQPPHPRRRDAPGRHRQGGRAAARRRRASRSTRTRSPSTRCRPTRPPASAWARRRRPLAASARTRCGPSASSSRARCAQRDETRHCRRSRDARSQEICARFPVPGLPQA